MGNDKNNHSYGALLEDIDSKLDIVLEGQSVLATSLELKAVDERLTRVEEDVKVIKSVVTATNVDLQDHQNAYRPLKPRRPRPTISFTNGG
jgi:hypothetical protein